MRNKWPGKLPRKMAKQQRETDTVIRQFLRENVPHVAKKRTKYTKNKHG